MGVLERAGDFIASALLWCTKLPVLVMFLRGVCSSMFWRRNPPKFCNDPVHDPSLPCRRDVLAFSTDACLLLDSGTAIWQQGRT
jgi:hypothetical protein